MKMSSNRFNEQQANFRGDGSHSTSVGDMAIFFTPVDVGRLPTRASNQQWTCTGDGTSQLWITGPQTSWRGFPVLTLEDKAWRIWLMGEQYGGTSPDVWLQHVLEGEGDGSRLNGHFLILAHHKKKGEWHVVTDRFGTVHAYYADNGSKAAIGTFFPTVAAVASRRELDWEGLTGFFAFGFFPGERTFFTDVVILRPASHYVFDAHGKLVKHERYWHWWHEPDYRRSFEDTVRDFADVFHEVMDDFTRSGRVAVPISGGLDSRSTVAAITRPERRLPSHLSLWSYSYGYSDDSVETRIAGQVAQARGLPFSSYTIRPYLFDRLTQVLAYTEGFQDITQCRQMFVRDEIAQRADALIAALWGDVWLDDMGLVGRGKNVSDSAVLHHTLHKISKKGSQWLLDQISRHRIGGDPKAILSSMVQDELAPLNHIHDPDFRVKALKMEQWSFRWSLPPIRVFQSAAIPKLVFYDTRLTDFFATVPSEYLQGRRLQIEYLKRYAPDLARITWQVYDANLYHYQHFNTWLLPKRVWKKAWRVLRRRKVLQRNWEVQFFNTKGRTGLQKWLLSTGLKLHEFVSPQAIRSLLDSFYENPTGANGYTVSMLLTFSTWLEHYG